MILGITQRKTSGKVDLDVVDTLRLYASFYDKAESGECSLYLCRPPLLMLHWHCRLHNYHSLVYPRPSPVLSSQDKPISRRVLQVVTQPLESECSRLRTLGLVLHRPCLESDDGFVPLDLTPARSAAAETFTTIYYLTTTATEMLLLGWIQKVHFISTS